MGVFFSLVIGATFPNENRVGQKAEEIESKNDV